jgi:hypothetical protein
MKHLDKCDPCSKSEMDFHSMPKLLTSVADSMMVAYPPISALDVDTNVIKFNISGSSDTYIDLGNTFLYIKGKLTSGTGVALNANSKACPVNLFAYALFSSCEMSINGKQVTQPNAHHPYIPYFQFLFNFGSEAKKTQFRSILWAKDTAENFDRDDSHASASMKNHGWRTRYDIASSSKPFEMYAPVISDVCNQSKLIINGCDVSFIFHRSRPQFCIMDTADVASEHKFQILEATLYSRLVKPSAKTLLDDERDIERSPCLYPMIKTDIRLNTIPANVSSKELTSVTTGRVPNRMIIGLTLNSGLVGSYSNSPWNFSHHNVRSLSLTIGGRQYPSKLFNLDYGNNLYMRAYMQMYEGLGLLFGDCGIDITYEEFANGFCFYVFDLTSAQTANCGESVLEPSHEADVNVQIDFKVVPGAPLSCVIYTETPALMEINKDRNVHLEYTN